jgi:predicted phage baseplate assembly protein
MPLPFPNLDDRDFNQLVEQALGWIKKDLNTDWTDLSPGDPGVVLLEAFAYLTEQMIYRLNRLPRKVYIAFLRMLGVAMDPPVAARVALKVWHPGPAPERIHLPRGSQVTTSEDRTGETVERPVFTTIQDVEIPPSSTAKDAVSVLAYHCVRVEESLGQSDGKPGQVFQVKRPPMIARLPGGASWQAR